MILRSLEVEGFRCFDRLLQLNDCAPGINVLAGPNGAGKSTLLRALRHVLVDSHSLTGANVKQAMAPWGRAISPRIRVTMENGGEEWRLEKKFLSGSFAKLERLEQGVFRPVAEGREAEAKVRAMLLADAPAKGLANESHLGLLQVLWTPQGAPVLPEWSAGVRATLQEAFGAALSSRASDQLAKRIYARFEEYFTPTGQVRKSSPVVPLQTELAQLREQRQSLETQWQAAGRNRESIASLRERIGIQAARLASLLPELVRAREQQQLRAEATSIELRARQAFDTVDRRVRQWREDVAAQQQVAQQVSDAEGGQAKLLAELTAAQALLPEIQTLEERLASLHQNGDDARRWPDCLRARKLDAERYALAAQLAAIPATTAIGDIRRLHQQLEIKRAALASASLRLTIEAEAPLTLHADGVTHSVSAAESLVLASPQSISIHLPGVARLTASSANAQAAELALEVETLTTRFSALAQGETIDVWEQRFAQRDRLQREMERKESEAGSLDQRRPEFADLTRRHPEWEANPPDIHLLREDWKSCKDLIDKKRTQFDLPAISAAEASSRTSLDAYTRRRNEIGARLAQHAATGPLETLEARQQEAGLALSAATARLEALQSAVPQDLNALEQSARGLEAAIAADKESAARLEGELAAQQSQNLYTRLAETEERLAECAGLLERQNRRAAAIQMLQSTLQTTQSTLTASLPDQIAECATRHWRHIAGPAAHAIRIDHSWAPAGLHVPDASAALDELSGGEAEQLAFATRLALAAQLAREHRQLAVFDDAFLATDPARAARILELLAHAAARLQIIILTCHPARYESLPDVRYFDLEKLKQ